MGDFNEHLLFGFLTALVAFHLGDRFLSLNSFQLVASSLGLAVGSVLPDIDHKKSRIHRSVRATLSLVLGLVSGLLIPGSLQIKFLAGLISASAVYYSFKFIKIQHRGFTHSISFATTLTSVCVVFSVYLLASSVPGLAVGIGLFSHLLLDTEFKIR